MGYLNSNPSTLSQLKSVFTGMEMNIEEDVSSLLETRIIKVLKSQNGEDVYAPTLAILNNIQISEFREAVVWQTVWATTGFLEENMCSGWRLTRARKKISM